MAKVLLTNKNTVWGVIVNPVSSDLYRHVLSFKDEATKTAFINQELFDGKDYKAEVDKQIELGFTKTSGATATFTINPKVDYPGVARDELLAKDFAIIKEDGKYTFWSVIGVVSGGTIVYDCLLDIFFTYDIKDMFNDKETRIERAMLDRWVEYGGKLNPTPYYYAEAIRDLTNGNFNASDRKGQALLMGNAEPIDEGMEELISYDPRKDDDIDILNLNTGQIKNNIKWGANISNDEKKHVLKNITAIKWGYIATNRNKQQRSNINHPYYGNIKTVSDDLTNFKLVEGTAGTVGELPYSIICHPLEKRPKNNGITDFEKRYISFTIDGRNAQGTVQNYALNIAPKQLLSDPFTLKNSFKILHVPPFDIGDIDTVTLVSRNNYSVKLKENSKFTFGSINYFDSGGKVVSSTTGLNILKPDNDDVFKSATGTHTFDLAPRDYGTTPTKADLAPTKIAGNKHKWEVKNKMAPYTFLQVEGITNSKLYAPQLFSTNLEMIVYNSYQLTGASATLVPLGYSEFGSISNIKKIENVLIDKTNETLPTSANAYAEFMTRNMEQRQQEITNSESRLLTAGLLSYTGLGVLGARYLSRKNYDQNAWESFSNKIAKNYNTSILGNNRFVTGYFDYKEIKNNEQMLKSQRFLKATGGLTSLAQIGIGVNFLNTLVNHYALVNSQKAQEADLKNTPDNVIYNNSDTIDTLTSRYYGFIIKRLRISPVLDLRVKEYFYATGYNLNGKLLNINNFLKTRYYFNYIQAPETYENIKAQLPYNIKLIINATLAEGITIWHVDDVNNFKGVKNYKYENTERKLLN